jgi:hypothetical protein
MSVWALMLKTTRKLFLKMLVKNLVENCEDFGGFLRSGNLLEFSGGNRVFLVSYFIIF